MAKNIFKKSYSDLKVDSKGSKLSENIGKGLNKKFCEEVKKARQSETVWQIRIPQQEKDAFFKAAGDGNASNVARILLKKYVKGEIE